MEYKDYYATLELKRDANESDIKRAYRKLARKYHPDVSKEKNAEEKFKQVQEAYEVLKDPQKRKAYDQLGSNWKSGQEFHPPPGWQQQGGQGFSGGFDASDLEGFSDFFSSIFGGQGRSRRGGFQGFGGENFDGQSFSGFQQREQRGQDAQAKIQVSLEDAFRGVTKTLQLQVTNQNYAGNATPTVRTLKVNIPAGALAGQQLRLAGQANPGIGGAPAGDLYLQIEIEPNALFTLQERDVYLTLPVTPWEAALGAEIKVPTLGGPVSLKLGVNSQSGQKLRLKGRGFPGKPTVGDQYVIVQVATPPANTEEQRAFYKKMAEVMPFNPRKDWPIG